MREVMKVQAMTLAEALQIIDEAGVELSEEARAWADDESMDPGDSVSSTELERNLGPEAAKVLARAWAKASRYPATTQDSEN